jgi:hypothetical protein
MQKKNFKNNLQFLPFLLFSTVPLTAKLRLMRQSFKHDALALDVERINVFFTSLTTRRHVVQYVILSLSLFHSFLNIRSAHLGIFL